MAEATKRVALVTGGAKRVGAAIVRRLADAGFHVVFTWHRSQSEAQGLADQLAATAIQADLTRQAGVAAVVQAIGSVGRLDVLVNNASIYEPTPPGQPDLDCLRRMMAIHVETPLALSRELSPLLRSSHGHIINMLDLLAERPWPQYLGYSATKAALWNLTLGLAKELAPDVTVNGIAPGVVEWPEGYPQHERDQYLKRVPLGRAGTPQDVANLVYFLVTEGKYITGQVIRLDGGRSVT
jgi:pteridine reductase